MGHIELIKSIKLEEGNITFFKFDNSYFLVPVTELTYQDTSGVLKAKEIRVCGNLVDILTNTGILFYGVKTSNPALLKAA